MLKKWIAISVCGLLAACAARAPYATDHHHHKMTPKVSHRHASHHVKGKMHSLHAANSVIRSQQVY